MLKFKNGVYISGLHPEMLFAIDHATIVYARNSHDCIVTSARGDRHGNHSHHFKGLAVDFRTRHLTTAETVKIAEQLQIALGDEYQVITETDHIHVEYDPKQEPKYILNV